MTYHNPQNQEEAFIQIDWKDKKIQEIRAICMVQRGVSFCNRDSFGQGHGYAESQIVAGKIHTHDWDTSGQLQRVIIQSAENGRLIVNYKKVEGIWQLYMDMSETGKMPKDLERCRKLMGVSLPWQIDYNAKIAALLERTGFYMFKEALEKVCRLSGVL